MNSFSRKHVKNADFFFISYTLHLFAALKFSIKHMSRD